jgi:two-component system, LytTR family, response regulator
VLTPGEKTKHLGGEREHRLYVLRPEDVDYVESHGNYVRFHAGNSQYISRDSLKRLSRVLAGEEFLRIERRLLLNIHAIQYAQRAGDRVFAFMLRSGVRLRSGVAYRPEILRVLPLHGQVHQDAML